MVTPKHKLSLWAGILGLNTLACPSIVLSSTIGSHLGDGSLLQLNSGDTVQATLVESGTFYGLHAHPNDPTTFNLPGNVNIAVGPAPQGSSQRSFGIALSQPQASVTGQALHIDVVRTDTGKAAGIAHAPLANPNMTAPAMLDLGTGSSIRVKGSGDNPGGGVPNIGGDNNFAIGIGAWNRELTLQANQLTLDVQSEKADAYGISKGVGTDRTHSIDLGTGSQIAVQAGSGAYGIDLQSTINNANVALPTFKADALTINAQGAAATALAVWSSNGRTMVDLGSDTRLNATGTGAAYALNLTGQTHVSARDLTLDSRADRNALGLRMTGLDNVGAFLGTTRIDSTGTGVHAYGVRSGSSYATASTQLNFEQVHIKAGDYGMNIQGRVNLELGGGSTIESSRLAGIWLIASRSLDSGAKIDMKADALNIRGIGASTAGLDVRGNAVARLNTGSFVQVNQGVGLYTDDSGQIFFHGGNNRYNYLLGERIGAYAVNNGKIELRDTVIDIQRSAGSSTGVSTALAALNRGRIEAFNTLIGHVSNESAHANYTVYASNGTVLLQDAVINTVGSSNAANVIGVVANAGGRVEATGSFYNNMISPTATAFLSQGANSLISASGTLGIYGSAQAKDKGRIRLDLDAGSQWRGSAMQDATGVIDVTLAQARWAPVQNSTINQLNMVGSTLDLRGLPTDTALTITSRLQGSGSPTIQFRPLVSPSNPDNFASRLIVDNSAGNSQGTFAVDIANDGAFNSHSRTAWTIVNTTGQPPSGLKFYTPYAIELGGYLYAVRPHANGKDWQVTALGDEPLPPRPDEEDVYEPLDPEPPINPWDPDPGPGPGPDPGPDPDPVDPAPIVPIVPIDPVDPDPDPGPGPGPEPGPGPAPNPKNTLTTTTAKAAANMFSIGYLMNIAEQQTLMQRMGDLRLNGEKLHNFWIRSYGGHYNGFARQKLDGFKMNYYGIQMGVDRRLGNLPVYTGMFAGYTHGDPKPTGGSAKAKSYYGGVYATYINEDSGIYVDGVLKFNRFKHNFSVEDTQRQRVLGDTSTNGMSASLEVGKRFHFNVPKQGWYLEPQVLFTYSRVNSTEFTATNGLHIRLDSYNSNIGRYGFSLGYEMRSGKTEYNLYWKTAFVREFSGRGHYFLNGEKEDHYFRGNWWSNGLGINARINQRHDLYLEVDTNRGKNFNTVNVNGGYRFIF